MNFSCTIPQECMTDSKRGDSMNILIELISIIKYENILLCLIGPNWCVNEVFVRGDVSPS